MKALSYHVTLTEPTLLTSLEGDPNESASFDYIPGSVLRGAVIGKYVAARKVKRLDAADEEMNRLFLNGTVRYLNGYPLDRLENRTLPVPLSWHREKLAVARQDDQNPAPVYDFAVNHSQKIDQPQGVKAPFCSLTEGGVRLVSPKRWLSIHTARNRRFGRAVKESMALPEEHAGAVFRYEALAPGQTFAALALCESDKEAGLLQELLNGEVYLGGSRKAGYGRAEISNVKEYDGEWREVGGQLQEPTKGRLTVTFLSDVLLRDEFGQFTVNHRAITTVLRKKLELDLELLQAFLKGEIVGGFNRKWGLPVPQIPAVSMGSVLVYAISGDQNDSLSKLLKKLKELEEEGIGEGKAEGFGRLAFNWHVAERIEVEGPIRTNYLPKQITIKDDESKKAAQTMVTRLFQRRLEAKLAARAVEYASVVVGDKKM